MKKIRILIGILGVVIATILLYFLFFENNPVQQTYIAPSATTQIPISQTSEPMKQQDAVTSPSPQITDTKNSSVIPPIAEFQQRITKKPFGILISPKTSPVQPERFSGYHTGVDIEYGDVAGDIMVSAIADGTVVISKDATGYGGVIAIEHSIDDKRVVAIYGHLDPKSLPTLGASVKMGDTIGILGDDKTPETDGERKHLHFGLSLSAGVDIRGYVQQKEELSGWLDPVEALRFE